MLSIKDFDEIVLDNPFFHEDNDSIYFETLLWKYRVRFCPQDLKYDGQTNGSCKFLIIEHKLSDRVTKVIREDDHLNVIEFTPGKKDVTKVVDERKLRKVAIKLKEIKRLAKKQIEKHNKTVFKLERLKVSFDFVSTQEFVRLLEPTLTKAEEKKLETALKKVEQSPIDYYYETENVIDIQSRNVAQSIFSSALFDRLISLGVILVIDWKSPYEEVVGELLPVFEKMKISFDQRLKRPENYETTTFLRDVSSVLCDQNYKMLQLGERTDTYLLSFVNEQNYLALRAAAKKIKIEVDEL